MCVVVRLAEVCGCGVRELTAGTCRHCRREVNVGEVGDECGGGVLLGYFCSFFWLAPVVSNYKKGESWNGLEEATLSKM